MCWIWSRWEKAWAKRKTQIARDGGGGGGYIRRQVRPSDKLRQAKRIISCWKTYTRSMPRPGASHQLHCCFCLFVCVFALDVRATNFFSSFSFRIIQDLIRQVISVSALDLSDFFFSLSSSALTAYSTSACGETNGKCVENYNSLMVASYRRAINVRPSYARQNENFPFRSIRLYLGERRRSFLLLLFPLFAIKDSNHKQALITILSPLFFASILLYHLLSSLRRPSALIRAIC